MKNLHIRCGISVRTALIASAFVLCGAAWNARAQFEITVGTGSTAQNFDLLSASGNTNVFTNDPSTAPADSTLDGWSLFNSAFGSNLTQNYRADIGGSNAGSFYSWGAAATTERALGGVGSGGLSGFIAFAATNNSTSTLTSFTLGFDGEQWRNGGATTPNISVPQSMIFEYGFGATFAEVTTWNAPGGNFNWTSPVFGTTAAAAVDGNTAGLVAGRGGAVSGLTWAIGDTIWLRWVETNDAGNDHGLAIDNFSLSWVAGTLPKILTWAPTSSAWDTTATNWQEAGPPSIAFLGGDTVNFTDSGLAGSASVLVDAGGVSPGGVNVSHTAGTYTLTGGAISAGSALQKTGNGTLVLGASYSNGLNSAGGVVRTAANEVLGNTSGITLGDGATLDLNGNSETVGLLNLTGATVTTGAGLLTIGGNLTMGVSPTDTPTTIAGNLSNGGATRIFQVSDTASSEDLILNANLTGAGRVNFDGSGTVRIGGDNSAFTGGLQMDSGLTYVLANAKALGTGQLFLNGGTLEGATSLTGVDALSSAVSLGGNGATFTGQSMEFSGALTFFGAGIKSYSVAAAQTVTFSGTLDNSVGTANAAISKEGPGTLVFDNDGSLYTGAVRIAAGNVVISTANGLGLGGVTMDATSPDSATLSVVASTMIGTISSGFGDGAANVVLGQVEPSVDPVVLTIVASFDGAYAGVIETAVGHAGKVVKSGTATQTLSGAQSYGTLDVVDGKAILSGALTSVGGSTINVVPTGAAAALDITVSETIASLNIGAGGVVTLIAPPPAPLPEFAIGADPGAGPLAAVPEPGSGILLLGGLATLLGLRRRA